MYYSKKIFLFILLMNLSGLLKAQDMILDTRRNKFLINQKSDKPRLDVIVQSFTDYEKNEISKQAVMDTITKPLFEKVSDTEYNVTASRMGEKLTFVIRDFEKLGHPYGIDTDMGAMDPPNTSREAVHYVLGKEKCAATQFIPFGAHKIVMKIMDHDKNQVYKLNVTFTYPKPQLAYIDVKPYPNVEISEYDSVFFKNYIKNYNLIPTIYPEGARVPKRIVVSDADLYFGFKQTYYDGKIMPVIIYTRINYGFWRGTGLSEYPFAHLYLDMTHDNDWLLNGKYSLFYTYDKTETQLSYYNFFIKHSWFATMIYRVKKFINIQIWLLSANPWTLAVLLCVIAFFIYRTGQKRAREAAKKTKLELQAIQAQLNPHFIFNAMGSIQGLINKNDIEKANDYLADFSKLLRNSLNNSEKEMIPLSEELRTLENYVRLEQLRFNFQYTFFVDENIQTSNVEIPSLLIQPLIENAIKHGISGLNDNGLLNVSFIKAVNDLVIEVQDNGKGFDVNQKSAGQGIRLTRERIKLLNKSKKKIEMKIESGNGTIARLTLKHAF